MINRDVEEKITGVLIQTQYRFWVDEKAEGQPVTATEANSKEKAAIDYYSGSGFFKKPISETKRQVKFHNLVNLQVQNILRILE